MVCIWCLIDESTQRKLTAYQRRHFNETLDPPFDPRTQKVKVKVQPTEADIKAMELPAHSHLLRD